MDTPIFDFCRSYRDQEISRLHMPGHKGQPFLGCEGLDLTEVAGADELYAPEGIIAQSEQNAASLFGSGRTLYSTEGSSQCIRAMVKLGLTMTTPLGRGKILASRNAHKAFLYACALLDADIVWLYPESGTALCSCPVTPQALSAAIAAHRPNAVYITSPDYLGQMADTSALARVCHEAGIPLLVDNAHGAYLHWLGLHPMDLGADICCDSAHKTLPVLTGGAYLHLSPWANDRVGAEAKAAMELFGSTSPSYLILQSLDRCNAYLEQDFSQALQGCIRRVHLLRQRIPMPDVSQEPTKVVLDSHSMGYTGHQVAEHLRENHCEPEYTDDQYVVCMFTPQSREADYVRLEQAILSLPARAPIPTAPLLLTPSDAVMTPREAILAPHETIPVERALGRICGSPTVSCPPAIPITVSGEIITKNALSLFQKYKIPTVSVVKR